MTKRISEPASIKATKSRSVKSSEKPAPAKLAEAKPDIMTPTPRSPRKEQLLDMLGRESGASSAKMITATGWLPHTLRAALSGLRKQGHNISRIKDESGNSRYQLTVSILPDCERPGLRRREQKPSRLSRGRMLLGLAYHLQEKALGGLSPPVKRQLVADDTTDNKFIPVTLRPGIRLVREWQNQTHVVTVGAGGSFLWQGQRRNSLSKIARLITGTRW